MHLASILHSSLIPWLDPTTIIYTFGPFALLGVGLIVFGETGLLIGFLLPGDTLLVSAGVLSVGENPAFGVNVAWVCVVITIAAFLGGEVGYLIGLKAGPAIFQRKEGGLFSRKNVERTNAFFLRFGGIAVILARFIPVVRTFAPVAAGVGKMHWPKYTLYNAIGAVLWGTGLTLAGFGVGHIPFVAHFVQNYLDVVLLAIVLIVLLPSIYHYVQALVKSRKAKSKHGIHTGAGDSEVVDERAKKLELDSEVLDPKHHGKHEKK